jgi:hypothetical protein
LRQEEFLRHSTDILEKLAAHVKRTHFRYQEARMATLKAQRRLNTNPYDGLALCHALVDETGRLREYTAAIVALSSYRINGDGNTDPRSFGLL